MVELCIMRTRLAINAALKIVGAAGLLGITVVAPNAAQALSLVLRKSSARSDNQRRVLAELRRQGLVYITNEQDEYKFMLAPAGDKRLKQLAIDEVKIRVPEKWDKKWRLVVFDIPVKHSTNRKVFIEHMQRFNFVMLQRSVWAHPAPCLQQVEQLAIHYNIARFCALMEVTQLDDTTTKRLLSHFSTLDT